MANIYTDIKNSIISISGRTFGSMTSKELREVLKQEKLTVKSLCYVDEETRKLHPFQYRNIKNTRYLLYGDKGITVAHRTAAENDNIITMYYAHFLYMLKDERAKFDIDAQLSKITHDKFVKFVSTPILVEKTTYWNSIDIDLADIMNDTVNEVRAAGYTTEDVILKPEFNCGDNIAQFNRIKFTNNMFDTDITAFLIAIQKNNNTQYFEHITGMRVGKSIYGIGNSCENNKIEFTLSFIFDEETTKQLKIKEQTFNSYMG